MTAAPASTASIPCRQGQRTLHLLKTTGPDILLAQTVAWTPLEDKHLYPAFDIEDVHKKRAGASLAFVAILLLMAVVGSYFVMEEHASESAIEWALLLIGLGAIPLFVCCVARPALFALLFMLAMVFSPRIAVGNIPGRALELRLEDFVFAAMLFWLFMKSVSSRIVMPPLSFPVVLYLGAALASTMIGIFAGSVPASRAVLFWLRDVEYMGLAFIFANLFADRKELLAFLRWALAISLVVPVYALWQATHGMASDYISFPLESLRARAQIGGFCLVFAVLSLVRWTETQTAGSRLFHLGSYAAHLAGIVSVASRAYFGGVVVATVLLLVHALRRATIPARELRTFALAVIVAGTIGYVLPKVTLGSRLRPQMEAIEGAGLISPGFLGRGRYTLYPKWVGGGNLRTLALFVGNGKGWSPTEASHPGFFHMADSSYGRIFGETGALGLIIFGAVVLALYRRARAIAQSTDWAEARVLASGMWVLIIAYALCSIFVEPFYATKSAEPFWMLAGVMFAAGSFQDRERDQEPDQVPAQPAWRGGSWM